MLSKRKTSRLEAELLATAAEWVVAKIWSGFLDEAGEIINRVASEEYELKSHQGQLRILTEHREAAEPGVDTGREIKRLERLIKSGQRDLEDLRRQYQMVESSWSAVLNAARRRADTAASKSMVLTAGGRL